VNSESKKDGPAKGRKKKGSNLYKGEIANLQERSCIGEGRLVRVPKRGALSKSLGEEKKRMCKGGV